MTSDSDGPADDSVDDSVNGGVEGSVGGGDDNRDRLRDDLSEDAAIGDGLREPVAVGVPAGSARAAARASAASASVTAGKGRATRSRGQELKRVNIAQRIMRYMREVASELRKVIWPTRNEMVTYSIVVIIFLIFMIAVTWGADFGFARLILWIFG